MADTALWRVIQQWMDGQIVRVNQSQLADAIGVNRQSLSQWKQGQARPNPENLRALRQVTRIEWALLTDALLRDMGYVEEEPNDGTATTQGPDGPAPNVTPIAGGRRPGPSQPVKKAARRSKKGPPKGS